MKKTVYSGPLFIAADHGGYKLKKRLVRFITNELNLKLQDMGAEEYDETDDYPDYVIPLAHEVVKQQGRGIVICKNGVGVTIATNKVPGVRAGIGYNLMAAETMMQDDNTNVLALAAKGVSEDHAMAIVKRWLMTSFSDKERHVRRLAKVQELENKV